MNIIQLEPSKLKDYSNNARKHPDSQIAQLIHSIEEFGFNVPVEVNANFVILSGHARVEAAKKMGLETIPVIVQHHLADDTKQKGYILAANKIAMNAEWDHELLIAELEELRNAPDFDMSLTEFSDEELNEMLGDMDLNGQELGDPDEIPEPPTIPVSQKGDVWLLGNHRLMCGDSTVITDVEILMDGNLADMFLTDPPYNVNYTGKTKDALKIENDSMSDDSFRQFLVDVFKAADFVLREGGVFYIWHADSEGYNFRGACYDTGWKIRQCLIWLKSVIVMGRQDYHWKHEPCLYGWKDGAAHTWVSDRKQSTVLEFDKPHRNDIHPTMKPVELMAYQIGNNTETGNKVLDLFGGSGSTLIACEKLNRTCYMMELDPIYVDTIIKRYQTYTGKAAIHEYSGKTYDEMNTLV